MRPLTAREQRTVRLGVLALVAYAVLFAGIRAWKYVGSNRTQYLALVREAQGLKQEIQIYQAKAEKAKTLMDEFRFDPAHLSRTTAVAQASSAIQQTAAGSGVQVSAVRESPARGGNHELAVFQLQCAGPVPAVTGLLGRLQQVGFPLIIESVQLTPEPMRPGQVKLGLTIRLLDFEDWKKEGAAHA
jgi:hypothetical protein